MTITKIDLTAKQIERAFAQALQKYPLKIDVHTREQKPWNYFSKKLIVTGGVQELIPPKNELWELLGGLIFHNGGETTQFIIKYIPSNINIFRFQTDAAADAFSQIDLKGGKYFLTNEYKFFVGGTFPTTSYVHIHYRVLTP